MCISFSPQSFANVMKMVRIRFAKCYSPWLRFIFVQKYAWLFQPASHEGFFLHFCPPVFAFRQHYQYQSYELLCGSSVLMMNLKNDKLDIFNKFIWFIHYIIHTHSYFVTAYTPHNKKRLKFVCSTYKYKDAWKSDHNKYGLMSETADCCAKSSLHLHSISCS